METKVFTIIDTFGFFFRSYYALPPLRSRDGFPTGLLKGFMDLIFSLGKDYHTDYLVFALDSKGDNFRKGIYDAYKANRETPPEDLLKQLPIAIEWIEKMGFKISSLSGFEADDIIATYATHAHKMGYKVRIVSHDKDLYQLIFKDEIILFDPVKKIELDANHCFEKYGVTPAQFIDYQALIGDDSDNVPGVKGIGPKGAVKLLQEYGTLDNIYANIETINPKGIKEKLKTSRKMAYMSRELVTLKVDVFSDIEIDKFHLPEYNPILNIKEELLSLGLRQVIDKVQKSGLYIKTKTKEKPIQASFDFDEPVPKNEAFEAVLLDTNTKLMEEIAKIPAEAIVAFDTETDGVDSSKASIVGFSFAYEEYRGFYVPLTHRYLGVGQQVSLDDAKVALQQLFTHKIVGQNLKYDLNILINNFDFTIAKLPFIADTMIMSWLLNPSSPHGLDDMSKQIFNHEMIKFDDVVGKGKFFYDVELESACKYAAEDAWMTLKLYHYFNQQLDFNLKSVMQTLELPILHVLIDMENYGIKVDVAYLRELLVQFSAKIGELSTQIFTLLGEEFNLNSTQQLSAILFEKLGLKSGKKTKNGYSTDERVLETLIGKHDVIEPILEYREYYKLRSTYIEPLILHATKDSASRIYTSFLQTGTATGRFSSKNPNLQNIPVKSELGRSLRRAFVAKEGYKLLSIDYSQIELRLLAHFSGDSELVSAFNHNEDIHLRTAIKLFGADASSKRHIAKTINFGLLYGMGSSKLSASLGITTKEAKTYIEEYFKAFGSVKEYMEQIKVRAKVYGYTSTLLGRRRYFDFNTASPMMYAAYEREAVNTVFQGSAADLIKMAMVQIDKRLDKSIANMALQIHDELIVEAKEDMVDLVSRTLKEIMENIYKLNVPLVCSVTIGNNWGELK